MVYANYEYYLEIYLGRLPEGAFQEMVLKASREIDKNINTRLSQESIQQLPKEAQEQLQYTACALIDLLYKKQENENTKVSSISIDGVSKNYKTMTNEEYNKAKKELLSCLPEELTRFL